MDEHLPWHEPLWRQIQERRAVGRLPHALLLGASRIGQAQFRLPVGSGAAVRVAGRSRRRLWAMSELPAVPGGQPP